MEIVTTEPWRIGKEVVDRFCIQKIRRYPTSDCARRPLRGWLWRHASHLAVLAG
jgi:hypothetical protein